MRFKFTGITTGTEMKISNKSGSPKPYHITRFTEIPSLKAFDIFGDLGIQQSMVPTEYELEGDSLGMQNVTVVSGSLASGPSKKSSS